MAESARLIWVNESVFLFQVKFFFQYPTDELEKPGMKSSQTTPSFKTNGNYNITKTKGSMDSLRVDTISPGPSASSNHKMRSQNQSNHDHVRRVPSSSTRHNRPLKVSPGGDRKGLVVPNQKGSGGSLGEQISDSLSTASDEDFSDTDTDDEWEGCEVTEV